jgi:hypothetical protein
MYIGTYPRLSIAEQFRVRFFKIEFAAYLQVRAQPDVHKLSRSFIEAYFTS